MIGLDASKFEKGLGKAEGGLKGFAKKAAVIGAAAGTALSTAVVGAMNIEQGNDKLAAQLGLSAKESERVGAVAGSLYANAYGGSMEEVNTAVGAVISSIKGMRNATSSEVEAMSAKVLDLAATFEVDVARASQVAGQMITSGIAKNGTQAMDLLFASMQRVPAAIREDLLDAVDEYGPFMESIGIKGEQAMGLLVKGAEKGMFGIDKTGDALKEFTIRATDMSTASKAGFDILGMSQEGMTKKLLAGGKTAKGAFTTIITGLQKIKDPAKQSQAALALFGTPLEDLSVAEIPKFLASLTNAEDGLGKVGGAAEKWGGVLNDNANTNLLSFGRQAKLAFVNILGGMVLPIINAAAKFLASSFGPAVKAVGSVLSSTVIPALKSFGKFIADNQVPIKIIAGLIAAVFIPHLIALGVQSMRSAAQTVILWTMIKAEAIKGAAAHSVAIVGMIGKWLLLGAQSLLHAAKVAAAWLIAMGPIGIVIAAVVGLVALIIAKWDLIKKWIAAGWNFVKSVTVSVWNAVTGFLKGVWSKITGFVSAAVARVKSVISTVWNAIKSVTSSVWNAIVGFIRGAINRFMGFIRGIGRIPGMIGGWIRDAFDRVKTWFGRIVDIARGLPGKIGRALSGLWDGLVSGLKGALNGVISMINGAIGGINFLIRGFNKLPGPDIPQISPIPGLAEGGVVTKPTLAMIGEGREAEAVIPLSKLDKMLNGGRGITVNGPLIGEVKTMGSRLSLSELQTDLAMQGAV